MSSRRLSWWLTRGVIAVCIALWVVSIFSFFIRPVVFPKASFQKISAMDVSGTAGFARQFSFMGDCAPFTWNFPGAERVLIDDVEVPTQGQQSFCFTGSDFLVKLTVWVHGSENIYQFPPVVLWFSAIPLVVIGVVVIIGALILIGITLRAPVLFPYVLRWYDRVSHLSPHTLTTLAVLWMVIMVFAYWLIRGSPGLVAIAGNMDDLRTSLRSIFAGNY